MNEKVVAEKVLAEEALNMAAKAETEGDRAAWRLVAQGWTGLLTRPRIDARGFIPDRSPKNSGTEGHQA